MVKRFLWWWRRKQEALDLEEELKAHLAIETHEQRQPHADPEEAQRAARKALGNVTRITEDVQDVWRFVWLDDLFRDFRFGARTLRRNPGFTLVVILTLAIGIGATGVLMQIVARRTPEFALRRAVGAQANDVIQLVLRQAGLPVLAGLCGGFVCTFAFSRVISNLLYGIEPADLIVLGSVTVTLLAVAGVAIALPAIRAVRIDPMIALRQD